MTSASNWPAGANAVGRAIKLLTALPAGAVVSVVSDHDVDGLSAGAIFVRVLPQRGLVPRWIVARRGEHPHTDTLRARIRDSSAAALVVVDMGSRSGPIVAGLPTVVVDHHHPSGTPDGAILVSAHDHPPIASSSWLAWHVASKLADVEALRWLAVLGAYGDLGASAPLPGFPEALSHAGKTHVSQAVALLNAARRAPVWIGEVAASVLGAAQSARDIARGLVPGVDKLAEARKAVAAEVARCGKTAPKISGRYALIRFSSRAQVHPLVAIRWTQRLHDKIVIVANDDFLPGRVNFALRSAHDLDLLEVLRENAPGNPGTEYGHGHARATGGSLTKEAFGELLANLGFVDALAGASHVSVDAAASRTSLPA